MTITISTPEPTPEPSPESFQLTADHVTLGQLLKIVGIIGSGGEAKLFLAQDVVSVNGEPESRRGRKLRAGDLVELGVFGNYNIEGEATVLDDNTSTDDTGSAGPTR